MNKMLRSIPLGTFSFAVYGEDPRQGATKETHQDSTTYVYDSANRLASVNGIPYTFDANGNFLNDGQNSYAYDSANRLTSANGSSGSFAYGYNGLGDRVIQNGIQYTLDLNTEFMQVLNDGANTYLYGIGRISQTNIQTEYFLDDALGSVRQLADADGIIALARAYTPFGSLAFSAGTGTTPYSFTGEVADANGLLYLRARYFAPQMGRFTTKDTWKGNEKRPMSYNPWLYVYANPINLTDPSGHDPYWCEETINPANCYMQWLYTNNPGAFGASSSTICPSFPLAEYLGDGWKITHYNYAMENDPAFPTINPHTGQSDYVHVGGLGTSRVFRAQFIYNPDYGIPMQGTGLAEDGRTYITIDYDRTQREVYPGREVNDWLNHTLSTTWFFKYGKGGKFAEGTPWLSVAISANEILRPGGLRPGNKVRIDGYWQIFTITDSGSFTDTEHIDVFIGPTSHAEALRWGTKYRKVWRVG